MSEPPFRLQKILDLRVSERDARRRELAQALQASRILQDEVSRLEQELSAARSIRCEHASTGEINVDALLDAQRFTLLIEVQQQQILQQRKKVDDEIDRRRTILVAADQRVRTLEKLRDRQAAEANRQSHRLESRQLDEIAQRRRP